MCRLWSLARLRTTDRLCHCQLLPNLENKYTTSVFLVSLDFMPVTGEGLEGADIVKLRINVSCSWNCC